MLKEKLSSIDIPRVLGTAASVIALILAFKLIDGPAVEKYSAAKNKKPIFDKIEDKKEESSTISISSKDYDLVVVEMQSLITGNRNIFLVKRFPTYTSITGELIEVSYYEVFTGKLLFKSGDSIDNITSDQLVSITELVFLLNDGQIGNDITREQAMEIYKNIKNEYKQKQISYGSR